MENVKSLSERNQLGPADRRSQVILKMYDNLAKNLGNEFDDIDKMIEECLRMIEQHGEVETDAIEESTEAIN